MEEGSAPVEVAPVDGLAAPEVYVRRPAPSPQPEDSPFASAVEHAQSQESAEEPSRPGGGVDIGLLHSQVVRARKAAGQARRQLGDDINAAFRRLGQSGGSRAVADFLLKQLEDKTLHDLVDSEGRSCRAVAVEALLAMGYPYALELAPEDLEHLRQDGSAGPLGVFGSAGLLLAALGGGVEATQVLSHGGRWNAAEWMGTLVHVGVILLTALLSALGKQGPNGRQLALTLLVVAGFAGVPLYLMGVTPAAVGIVGAIAAALLLSRR